MDFPATRNINFDMLARVWLLLVLLVALASGVRAAECTGECPDSAKLVRKAGYSIFTHVVNHQHVHTSNSSHCHHSFAHESGGADRHGGVHTRLPRLGQTGMMFVYQNAIDHTNH